jgi:hypothetical protein
LPPRRASNTITAISATARIAIRTHAQAGVVFPSLELDSLLDAAAGRRCVIVCSTVVVLTTVVPGAVVVLRIVVPGAVVVLRIVVVPGAVVVTVVVLAGVVLEDVVLVVVVSTELPPAATVAAKRTPATNIATNATNFITLATDGMMTARNGQRASKRLAEDVLPTTVHPVCTTFGSAGAVIVRAG